MSGDHDDRPVPEALSNASWPRDLDLDAIIETYHPRVFRYLVWRIYPKARGRIEAESLAQSVWGSVARRITEGEFQVEPRRDGRDAVLEALCAIALVKLRRRVREIAREERHSERLRAHLDAIVSLPGQNEGLEKVIADEIVELIDRKVRTKLSPDHLPVFELRLRGAGATEIAEELGRTLGSVRNSLREIRKTWDRFVSELVDDDP